MSERRIDIRVPVLARVEGEGALELRVEGGRIEQLRLRIYEPPRYFEKFLEGRSYKDVLDTVARICGICPVAYQMSAVQALEQIFELEVPDWVAAMRRVFYCGEWLQSHSLHIHLLALPDFLGYANVIELAAEHPGEVRRGLALQGLGNDLIRLLGGRSVHPVGLQVGGFSHAPSEVEVASLLARLKAALPQVEALARWTAALPFPDDEQDFISVSLRHVSRYPLESGVLASSDGQRIAIEEYAQHFEETHVPHSTALFSHFQGKPYLVGPLARLNLNLDLLPPTTRRLIDELDVRFPSNNMFHSIVARAIEMHITLQYAIEALEAYRMPEKPYLEPKVKAGVGYGCTEAPRGILWHRYELDEMGRVVSARIVPPTAQNQARIEQDLRGSLMSFGLDQPDDKLRLRAETVIRNYDPCISCATHFLRLKVERS